jgi:hypothetical protein
MKTDESNKVLTDKEIAFCELLINGNAPYCGNIVKCYEDVFDITSTVVKGDAKRLLQQPHIQEYIKLLKEENAGNAEHIKNRISENLLSIMDETATAQFFDRRGTKLSVAPLRSVSVQAAKALMAIHPIREANVNRLNIEGSGKGGVTFNVIVPMPEQKHGEIDEQGEKTVTVDF